MRGGIWISGRWDESPAYCKSLLVRGVYIEILALASRLNGRVPNNPASLRAALGCTSAEWRKAWSEIAELFIVDVNYLRPLETDIVRDVSDQRPRRPHIPIETRREVMERDKVCVNCGADFFLQLDHIIPFSRGGPDTVENLRVLCRTCNIRRGAPAVEAVAS